MSCENGHFHFDLNNIFRTAVGGAVVLAVAFPLGNLSNSIGRLATATAATVEETNRRTGAQTEFETMVDELQGPCIDYTISKADSKLERQAKTAIDDYFGGEVSYAAICPVILS